MSEMAMGIMPDREGERMRAQIEVREAQKRLAELMKLPEKTPMVMMEIGWLNLKIAMLSVMSGSFPGKMS